MNGMSSLASAGSGLSSLQAAYEDDANLLTDKNRYTAIQSPYLDANTTFLATMTGAEELGRDFCYTVDIVLEEVFTSFTQSVGEPATVAIKESDGSTRYINGMVEEISFVGIFDHRRPQYRLKLVSWLTFLKYRKNCRIFQNQTSRQIAETIFAAYSGSSADFSGVSGYLPTREFCVQFDESDFDFISRLLEQDGIWYYFDHCKTRHVMMLRDSINTNECTSSPIFTNQNSSEVGQLQADNFSSWRETAKLTSHICRLKDYNHMDPKANMEVDDYVAEVATGGYPTLPAKDQQTATTPSPVRPDTTRIGPNPTTRESYDYPGRYFVRADGEFYVKIKAEREASRAYTVCIEGTPRQLTVGNTFKAQNPFAILKADVQPLNKTEWRAVRIDLELRGERQLDKERDQRKEGKEPKGRDKEGSRKDDEKSQKEENSNDQRPFFYNARVHAVTKETPFRPQLLTPRPRIHGPQTAVVEGKPNTIYVDELDRVKVRFFWDLEARTAFENSCWIRVAQSMAGAGFGGLVVPRDQQEVIVQFIDGNPDWPIITGAVYNAVKRPPELLQPASARSIFRTQTIGGGNEQYNELRFDDTLDNEEVYLRAQHDYNVRVRNNHDIGASGRFSVSVSPAAASTDESPTLVSKKTPGCYLELGKQRIALLIGGGGEPPNGLIITPEGVNIVGTTVGIFSNTELTLVAKPGLLMGSQPALTEAPPPEQEALQVIYESLQASPPII